jgi:hypothetical protein
VAHGRSACATVIGSVGDGHYGGISSVSLSAAASADQRRFFRARRFRVLLFRMAILRSSVGSCRHSIFTSAARLKRVVFDVRHRNATKPVASGPAAWAAEGGQLLSFAPGSKPRANLTLSSTGGDMLRFPLLREPDCEYSLVKPKPASAQFQERFAQRRRQWPYRNFGLHRLSDCA